MPISVPTAAVYGMSGERLNAEEKAFFRDQNPYGYILFARNCQTPDQIRSLIDELRECAGRADLPVLIDQEGGRVARLKPPHWREAPPAATFAKLAQTDLDSAAKATYHNARLIGGELAALGITVDCAPLADIPVAGAHDIIGDRAYGATPESVVPLARAMADGLLSAGILPVLKHIPGHGRANVDSHEELPRVITPLDELARTDFVPFRELADLPMGMTAHIVFDALDAMQTVTMSPAAIRYIRTELAFDGLLYSDDLSMKALQGDFTARAADALAAGCDIVLHCNGRMDEMVQVARGVGSMNDDAVRRAERAWQMRTTAQAVDVAVELDHYQRLIA